LVIDPECGYTELMWVTRMTGLVREILVLIPTYHQLLKMYPSVRIQLEQEISAAPLSLGSFFPISDLFCSPCLGEEA
jgi:hypothetical protein